MAERNANEKEKKVYDVLEELGIEYEIHRHEAIFGAADAEKFGYHQPGLNVKNMLVRERKREEHYLVILPDDERLDFKRYAPLTGWTSKMTFADEEDVKKYLGVEIGSCSVFGLLYDTEKHVTVLLDKVVAGADLDEKISFHPNNNTATVTMKVRDLYSFLDRQGNKVIKEV